MASAEMPVEGRMFAQVLSCAPDLFRGKNGQPDTQMYRVYMADARGRVGYVYSRAEYPTGSLLVLGLAERDGRLKLSVLGLAADAPQI